MRTRTILLLTLLPWLAAAARAQETARLTVGDKAPAFEIEHWVKTRYNPHSREWQEIDGFQEGKIYVLEFWATWCGPCRAGMPHVSELQEQYDGKGVTIIGVSDEPLQTVTRFLTQKDDAGTQWYDKIKYTLATDPDESVWEDYFRAAGQDGIPCAFIIGKDGHIEWIGHPARMDKPLEAVVSGTWDRQAEHARYEKARAADVAMQSEEQRLTTAWRSGDWDTVLEILDGRIADFPDEIRLRLQKFNALLVGKKDSAAAYSVGKTILEDAWHDAQVLNSVAWTVVDDEGVEHRDLDFAMKAAVQANQLTDSKDAAILDTLARVWYEKGVLEKALEWQRRAVEHVTDPRMGADLRKTLDRYETEAAGKGTPPEEKETPSEGEEF